MLVRATSLLTHGIHDFLGCGGGRTSQAVLEGFGLTDSGVEYNEFDRTPALAGAPLRGGWYVVIDHDVEEDFEFDYASKFMAEISLGGEAIYCYDSYHGPVSASAGWSNGREVWALHHVGDDSDDVDNLDIRGELPPSFTDIRAGAIGSEDVGEGITIFDVPLEIARALTGFRRDADDIPQLTRLD